MRLRNFYYFASLAIVIVYFLAFMVQFAFVFDYFYYDATRFSRYIQTLIVFGSIGVMALMGRGVALIGMAAALTLVAYHLLFSFQSGSPTNPNVIFSYISLLAFVPIVAVNMSIKEQTRLLFYIALGYVVFYVVANNYLVGLSLARSAASADSAPGGLIDSGDDRGVRVFLAGLLASYVAFYLTEDKQTHWALRLAGIAMACTAIWLSKSRVFMAVFAVLFIVRLVRMNNRPVAAGMIALFLMSAAVNLYGVVDQRWNPYAAVSSDASGLGRYRQYQQATTIVRSHWVLGVGIEPSFEAAAAYLRVPRRWGNIFWSDLGVIGPFGAYGIVGLLFFLFVSVTCMWGFAKRSNEPGLDALRLNCALSACCGFISPYVLWPPSAFFTAMLFGAWLRRRHATGVASAPATPALRRLAGS